MALITHREREREENGLQGVISVIKLDIAPVVRVDIKAELWTGGLSSAFSSSHWVTCSQGGSLPGRGTLAGLEMFPKL